jgi:hypothetical protein
MTLASFIYYYPRQFGTGPASIGKNGFASRDMKQFAKLNFLYNALMFEFTSLFFVNFNYATNTTSASLHVLDEHQWKNFIATREL